MAAAKPALCLATGGASRSISRSAAAGMLLAARFLQARRLGYSVAYSIRAGIVQCEGPRGIWQIQHQRGAA